MEAYRKDYPVSVLCNTLGVSLSGYYAWKKRPVSQHQLEDSQLAEQIHVAYQASRQVYGSPRIHAELRDQGIICSRRRVARLMRERGLSACRLRHRTITTHSVPGARVAPNRLNQEFTATRRLGEVGGRHNSHLDVRRVVIPGSSARSLLASGDWMGHGCNERHEALIERAFQMALLGRNPPTGLLFHSDRGSQYTSDASASLARECRCYCQYESYWQLLR